MRSESRASSTYLAMNTVMTHTILGGRAAKAVAAARKETRRLEESFSRFLPGSDIAKLSAAAGTRSVRLRRHTKDALRIGLRCTVETGGCFDMTVGPLVKLWQQSGTAPDAQAVEAAKRLTGAGTLQLGPGNTARLSQAGQSVDLGGIGKGYAVDRITEIFRRHGVRSAFTDFGGNVAVLGHKPDGTLWRVGIRHPLIPGTLIGVLAVSDTSVVTSGDDQRAVQKADGRQHSHIIDPRSGLPAQSGLASVTVVSPCSAQADALATALYLAGRQQGLAILKRFPGAEAVFVTNDASVTITPGLARCFQTTPGNQATIIGGII